jgi:cyclin B
MGVIHWIISVSERFELLPETLYLTINIFDRYLEKKTLLKKNLQLIASTCLLIASKYEEIYAPEIRDLVYISKGLFNKDNIINIEYDILKCLNFNLLTVSPYIFLVRFFFISGNDNIKVFYLASYILNICLTDISFCNQSSSLKACIVLYISRKIILENNKNIWNNSLKIHSGYSEKDLKGGIKECAKYIYNYTNNKYTKNYKNLPSFIKYSSEKYDRISIFFDEFLNDTINNNKKGKVNKIQ